MIKDSEFIVVSSLRLIALPFVNTKKLSFKRTDITACV